MAAANQKAKAEPAQQSSFADIMQEQAVKSQRQLEEDKRVEQVRASQNKDMKFDYIGVN